MSLAAAAWCIKCGGAPELAITVERRGALMHYGSCWAHVVEVAHRAYADTQRIDLEDRSRPLHQAEPSTLHELDP